MGLIENIIAGEVILMATMLFILFMAFIIRYMINEKGGKNI